MPFVWRLAQPLAAAAVAVVGVGVAAVALVVAAAEFEVAAEDVYHHLV